MAISSIGTPLIEGPNHPTYYRSSADEMSIFFSTTRKVSSPHPNQDLGNLNLDSTNRGAKSSDRLSELRRLNVDFFSMTRKVTIFLNDLKSVDERRAHIF